MSIPVTAGRKDWESGRQEYKKRVERGKPLTKNGSTKIVDSDNAVTLLEAIIQPGDRVAIEGNNQKQADFLADCLCRVDKSKVNKLHMVQSVISRPSHCEIFERGIAEKVDFSFSGPQSTQVSRLLQESKMQVGEIHTYLELFSRYFVDLTPRVALVVAARADQDGNLYTGPNTEDTPAIVEATHFKQGIVIAEVESIVDKLPRVDIPGDWIDFIIPTGKPCYIEPLFTRDPSRIRDVNVLIGMMVIKGIYREYGVRSLNHGIGYATAAIELLLPTYAQQLGLRGKICTHWTLNPHPTLIPAIELGFVDSVHCFGSEVGMEEYVAARPDIFFVGPDGNLRSNRAFSQAAGHYAVDAFVGATLQIDRYGNSSTAVVNRIAGFGGAPNMGCDAGGRRHSSEAWVKIGKESAMMPSLIGDMPRGRKLVVQMVETRGPQGIQCLVDKLDAWDLMKQAGLKVPPVMIYGDAVTQIVTEVGLAHLHKCASLQEREAAIKAIAGDTDLGKQADPAETADLRQRKIVQTCEDLEIDPRDANRSLLVAQTMDELVEWSGGRYKVPEQFRKPQKE
ncbi:malonate decarboxylase subunit alpha [Desulfomonile tiedjei]|uniref:Malonate decarboxylase, alpha subunit n=1 Tax=Desulfomonile tiedjei (strain ATCC 49306 / DSM 6799 / DCB-1) TaxID=706587 RepID=I4C571_DESTA|nr:malonate decarboxylase subunit alpha [Desulfomonile tiedjei]AFM24712.1 malonate decarboxylase, alpha subunit [Desulfomonile tiedjei DSM 6799]